MEQNNENPQPQSSEPTIEEPTETVPAKADNQNARNLAMLCHLLGIFTSFVGPLIIWLIKKDDDEFIDSQGKEALNWQISLIIYIFAAYVLMFILIGIILLPALVVVNIVFCIIGAVRASNGIAYTYPLTIRFLK